MHRREAIRTGLAGIGTLVLSKTAEAFRLADAAPQKQWAILYGSQCGSTKDAATWINEGLGEIADVIDVDTDPTVTDYEGIILGGWIQAGNLVRNVKDFINANKEVLQPRIHGLFTVCGNNGSPVGAKQVNDYLTTKIVALTGVTDKPAKLFNGRSDPACNNLGMAYDLLEKEDCVNFGETILSTATIPMNSRHLPQTLSLHRVNGHFSRERIRFICTFPCNAMVTLTVSSLDGKTCSTLLSGQQPAGYREVNWNTRTAAPGLYLCRLRSGSDSVTRTIRVTRS
ncbi:MAG: hypothetical protein JW863_20570 [Chitinispirillaceae bacterium]|nr:hypothetical protein [Chitinispirillaceae bacterium]